MSRGSPRAAACGTSCVYGKSKGLCSASEMMNAKIRRCGRRLSNEAPSKKARQTNLREPRQERAITTPILCTPEELMEI